jgi:hypothetical protein
MRAIVAAFRQVSAKADQAHYIDSEGDERIFFGLPFEAVRDTSTSTSLDW